MWYKIWTFVAESIPVVVLSLLFTVIAIVFVIGTHMCDPPKPECPDHPFNFTITVEK